jgi:hypothetical protein
MARDGTGQLNLKITGKNGIKKLDFGISSNFSKKYKNFLKGSRYF